MKLAVKLLLIILLFYLSAVKTFAQSNTKSNFSTDIDVTYTVNENANTKVAITGTLKNLTDKYYASSYSVQVGFSDIKNLSATVSDKVLTPTIVKSPKGTTITLIFGQSTIGLNNKLNFNISFDTSEVAINNNNTWDINIPGIAKENDFSSFNVIINYPKNLGKPTFIKPRTAENNAKFFENKLIFTKENLGNSGVSIAFGDYQIYRFNLVYHLENKNLFPVSTEIALPPDTNYQKVLIDNINPRPVNVTIDKDGNWLAKYVLGSNKSMDINVLGKAKVFINPKEEYLSPQLAKEYLKQDKYWDSDNPEIKSLAGKLKTPYAIYQYVSKTLAYDFSRVELNSPRLGSLNVLKKPNSAVCLEFTDLFIALARAAGIPAREINGYAYTNNRYQRPLSFVKDILHAWPEYYDYDKKTWIMVDPTWANTTGGVDYFNTLDFNRVSFVIKGLNSSYPVPAGGYKRSSDANKRDVNVVIDTFFTDKIASASPTIIFADTFLAGLPVKGFIKIANLGNSIIKKQQVTVDTNFFTEKGKILFTQDIPPFGYETLALSFANTSILTNANDTIRITADNKSISKNIKIRPFYANELFILGGLTLASIIVIISFTAYLYRRLSFFRQKGKGNLRRKSK